MSSTPRPTNPPPYGIHWFRRDLRIEGNLALRENLERSAGRVVGLFCFDSSFLKRQDFSHNRFAFFLATLRALKADLAGIGVDLLVLDQSPTEAFRELVAARGDNTNPRPGLVTFSRDYEPFARARDEKILSLLSSHSVPVFTERDHLLFEPREVVRAEEPGAYYKVYSPFYKLWLKKLQSETGRERVAAAFKRPAENIPNFSWANILGSGASARDSLDRFESDNGPKVTVPIPSAGHRAGVEMCERFKGLLDDYARDRSTPALDKSSRFSMFLKNGSLTIGQIVNYLGLTSAQLGEGPAKFLNELCWREFFYSILFHRPDVETGPFIKKYSSLEWSGDQNAFMLWKNGRTGVPIVDAGMRELAEDGWINNRVRIIVATFLVKDLHLDWRWGEEHFMHLLLDGDLAPNNGNWQWCASTGADANPPFRVLNPWSQSVRFDPDGDYIKRFVPELARCPAALLHDETADRSKFGYPKPIIVHSFERQRAIAMYNT